MGKMSASRVVAALLVGMTSLSSIADATDYFHECRTADGVYVINDEALARADGSSKQPITYATMARTLLAERKGYCQAKGKRFEFESSSYVLRIKFQDRGQTQEVDALCELAADGLPAAYKCEREVITRDFKASGNAASKPNAQTVWSHNGSVMRLEANGADRVFVYDVPRRGMVEAGAKRGDRVFEGRREGQAYKGTAYYFSRTCGRVAYEVVGTVGADERSVVLEGQAPSLDAACKPKSYRRDTMRFDLVER